VERSAVSFSLVTRLVQIQKKGHWALAIPFAAANAFTKRFYFSNHNMLHLHAGDVA
jgi:hypothetical protein